MGHYEGDGLWSLTGILDNHYIVMGYGKHCLRFFKVCIRIGEVGFLYLLRGNLPTKLVIIDKVNFGIHPLPRADFTQMLITDCAEDLHSGLLISRKTGNSDQYGLS